VKGDGISIDAQVIAGDAHFLIVRQTDGEKVTYVLEVHEGFDALGCEKWGEIRADGKVVRSMRDFIIRTAVQGETSAQNQ
jgi:hypothetical protein